MRSDLRPAGELAVVVAVYNSAPSLQELAERLLAYWQGRDISVHLVLVDDGSTDNSWQVLCRLAEDNSAILAVRLRRNFGQQNALLCGLQLARGHRYLITMDDDLQHPPELGGSLYDRAKEDTTWSTPSRISAPAPLPPARGCAARRAVRPLHSQAERDQGERLPDHDR